MESLRGNHGSLRFDRYFGGGMAHFQRVIFGLVLALFVTSSFATISLVAGYKTGRTGAGYSFRPLPADACADAAAALTVDWGGARIGSVVTCDLPSNYIYLEARLPGGGSPLGYSTYFVTGSACPVNSTGTTTCTCNAGYTDIAGVCTSGAPSEDTFCKTMAGGAAGYYSAPYATDMANPNGTYTHLCVTKPAGSGGSKPGCSITVDYNMAVPGVAKYGSATFTGAGCTADPASTGTGAATSQPAANCTGACLTGAGTGTVGTTAPALSCPAGSVIGTVNGTQICSPSADLNMVMAGPTITATTGSGTTAAPINTIDAAAPSTATTEKSQISCTGGNCTTVKTFTASDGSVVGTNTIVQSVTSLCSSSPDLPICRGKNGTATGTTDGTCVGSACGSTQTDFCTSNPTSILCVAHTFSGTCGSAPACSGDAIACAIAAATFESDCILKTASSESALYTAKSTLTGNQTGSLPGNDTVNIGSGSFSQADDIGGSGGVADLNISVSGRNITLPFSNLNQYLVYIGNLFLACAFLLSVRIVSRG